MPVNTATGYAAASGGGIVVRRRDLVVPRRIGAENGTN
jgi:hypothetical protein